VIYLREGKRDGEGAINSYSDRDNGLGSWPKGIQSIPPSYPI